jgi:DNA-binding response OmpR family regulator
VAIGADDIETGRDVAGTSTGAVPEPPTGLHVLVIEDDPAIGRQLERGLVRAGYSVSRAGDGSQALLAGPADVILLDLGLPDIDGLELCQRLRARSSAAIIAVTARSEEATRVATLDAGADDYLVKPFGFGELLARVRAVLRRISPGETGQYRHGALTVDPRTRRVLLADREVALTPKEFDLLACLAEDPGRALTRQEILERAWGGHWYGPSKVLDVHVASLRRKLGDPTLIETVYGVGYRLASID